MPATDVDFTAFAFAATGAPTRRTMPARLAEVKNVVDFGADPTGSNASATTAAIQAAVDWTAGANRGIIYFPVGSYQVNAPITFNYSGDLSICFRGEVGSSIFGNFSGYIFDRHLTTAAVTITIASPGVVTDTAHGLSANTPIRFETTVIGGLPTGLTAGTTYYVKTVLSANTYTVSATSGGTVIATTGSQSGSHKRCPINTSGGRIFERLNIQNGHASGGAIRLGATNGGVIRDCGFSGWVCVTTEDAVGVSSRNIYIENNGFGNNGTITGSHFIIIGGGGAVQGCTMSGAETAVRAYGSGLHMGGNRSERNDVCFRLGVDSGGNNVGLKGFSLISTSTEGSWTPYYLQGRCEGFVIASCGHFSHASDNSGPIALVQTGQYGIRIGADCARGGIIQGCTLAGPYEVGGIVVEDATARGDLVIRENQSVNSGGAGGSNWIFPSNAYTACFVNNNEQPTWTYAQRPTGGNVFEGEGLDITDSNTATWGATVAGGGSNHIRMRYNGTNWSVVGK